MLQTLNSTALHWTSISLSGIEEPRTALRHRGQLCLLWGQRKRKSGKNPLKSTITCCFPQHRTTGRIPHPLGTGHGSLRGWSARAAAAPALGRHRRAPGERSHPAGRPRWAAGDKRQLRPLTGPAGPPAPAPAAPARGRRGQREERLAAVAPPCGRQAALPSFPPSRPESGARPDSARQDLRPARGTRPLSPLPPALPGPRPVTWDSSRSLRGGADGAGRAGAGGRAAASAAPARSASRGRVSVRAPFSGVGAERPRLGSRAGRARRGSLGAVRSRWSPRRRARSRAGAEQPGGARARLFLWARCAGSAGAVGREFQTLRAGSPPVPALRSPGLLGALLGAPLTQHPRAAEASGGICKHWSGTAALGVRGGIGTAVLG